MSERKEKTTPGLEARRRYEKRNKDKRKETVITWGTRLSREQGEEINAFLQLHGLSKVSLINAGYQVLQDYVRYKESGEENEPSQEDLTKQNHD